MLNKNISFRFKNNRIYNSVAFILFIILIINIYIIILNVNNNLYRILYILLSFIIINIILLLTNKFTISRGIFNFDDNQLTYETVTKSYTINYDEVEYIIKNNYIDDTSIIKKENYEYIIKIRNEGTFTFKYTDNSLVDAIKELALRSNIEIDN